MTWHTRRNRFVRREKKKGVLAVTSIREVGFRDRSGSLLLIWGRAFVAAS